MKQVITVFILILANYSYGSEKLPSSFKKCNRKDPKFEKCLIEAANFNIAQLGTPHEEIGLPSFDPFEIKEIKANLDSPFFNITQVMTNCKVWNLTHFQANRFRFDFKKKTMDISGVIDEISGSCENAAMDGKVAYIPIKGEGIFSGSAKNYSWNIHMEYKEVHKNNETYMKEVRSRLRAKKPDVVNFKLEKFFGDDKLLDTYVNRLLEDNWRVLYDVVEDIYLDVVRKHLLRVINVLFSKVSMEEAFDSY